MNVIKLLGQSVALSDTPSTIGSGTKILLQHDHAGGNAHLVTLKNASGTVLGSVKVHHSVDMIIDKEPTDTLEVADGITDISAVSVSHMG